MALLSNLYPNIKGAQGVQGVQGTLGPQGTQGIQGIQGFSYPGMNVTNVTSPYTLQTTDVGSLISINSGVSPVSISSETFSFGNSFMIYNGTSTQQTIAAGTGVSFYSGDGTTDVYEKKYLEENDLTTILCSSNNDEFIFSTPLSGDLPIITSGLQLNLDARDSSSYPGSGTTWYDLSSNGNDATLTNGPTYTSANGGAIIFDGSNDYADFFAPNLGTTTTVEMWVKLGASYTNRMFFGWLLYDVYCGAGNLGYNTANTDVYGISSATVSSLGLVNNWKHYVFEMRTDVSYTNNKIYINGSLQTLSQQLGSENASFRSFNSGNGRISGWRNDTLYPIPMENSIFRVYNRALTSSEIQQNFDALKGRYGL